MDSEKIALLVDFLKLNNIEDVFVNLNPAQVSIECVCDCGDETGDEDDGETGEKVFFKPDESHPALFEYGKNRKGKSIFQIYPGDSSPTSERVILKAGSLYSVYPEHIVGDGGRNGYKCFYLEANHDGEMVPLYVNGDKGGIVSG